MLIFEGKEISTDSEGYLKETTQWSEALAVAVSSVPERPGKASDQNRRSAQAGKMYLIPNTKAC